MDHLTNYHAFEVTYLGPTNYQGSRVKIKSLRFDQAVIIPFDYYFANTFEIAQSWLINQGFELIGKAEATKSYLIISKTFKPLKP
jgi:hypothetical protein